MYLLLIALYSIGVFGIHDVNILRYDQIHHYNLESPDQKSTYKYVIYIPSVVTFEGSFNPDVIRSIESRGKPIERRQAIRDGLAKSKIKDYKLYFIMGNQSSNYHKYDQQIKTEQEKYGDLLIFNCPDLDLNYEAYSGMTIKVGYAFRHAYLNHNYQYFVRASDDAYTSIDNLDKILSYPEIPKDRLYMGNIYSDNVRTGSQRIQIGSRYPNYMLGIGFVISSDLSNWIGKMTDGPLKTDWPEDAVVGIWLLPFGVNIVDAKRWFYNKGDKSYDKEAIMIHAINPIQIKEYYN